MLARCSPLATQYASPIVSTLYTSKNPHSSSKCLYRFSSMLITMNGVAREQMLVKPTMSLNSIVTSGYVLASICAPSHSRSAISAGKMSCSRLTFFFRSLMTAAFASSIELFSLSIRRRSPSWARACSPTSMTSRVASCSGMSEMNSPLHVSPSSPSRNGEPTNSSAFDSGQNTIWPLISSPLAKKSGRPGGARSEIMNGVLRGVSPGSGSSSISGSHPNRRRARARRQPSSSQARTGRSEVKMSSPSPAHTNPVSEMSSSCSFSTSYTPSSEPRNSCRSEPRHLKARSITPTHAVWISSSPSRTSISETADSRERERDTQTLQSFRKGKRQKQTVTITIDLRQIVLNVRQVVVVWVDGQLRTFALAADGRGHGEKKCSQLEVRLRTAEQHHTYSFDRPGHLLLYLPISDISASWTLSICRERVSGGNRATSGQSLESYQRTLTDGAVSSWIAAFRCVSVSASPGISLRSSSRFQLWASAMDGWRWNCSLEMCFANGQAMAKGALGDAPYRRK
uniref:Uncharacterized protein n=1 Tax=Anopheles coluzzii TaxID=1518534 RepID=A0A8W7P122_ANOCL